MRNIKLLSKYKHFKGGEYLTLCISNPVSHEVFLKSTISKDSIVCLHTENNIEIKIYQSECGNYYHLDVHDNQPLMIYMSLSGNFKIFARPLSMFASKVDKVKYPNAKQEYRLEEVNE